MGRVYLCVGVAALSLVVGPVAASADQGKEAYVKYGCWQCHGFEGQGGVTGPKLAPDPLPAEAFNAFVRTTNRAMPPYSEAVLPNEDLTSLYTYLTTIKKGPDAKSIPLLNP